MAEDKEISALCEQKNPLPTTWDFVRRNAEGGAIGGATAVAIGLPEGIIGGAVTGAIGVFSGALIGAASGLLQGTPDPDDIKQHAKAVNLCVGREISKPLPTPPQSAESGQMVRR